MEKILNSDGGSDSDDDSLIKSMPNEMSKGDKDMHGVVTTKQGILAAFLFHIYHFVSVINATSSIYIV